jgi:hypothetical protein
MIAAETSKTNEMRLAILNCLIFAIEFPFCIAALHDQEELSVRDRDVLSRKKRYLSFPDGSILQVSGFLSANIFRLYNTLLISSVQLRIRGQELSISVVNIEN